MYEEFDLYQEYDLLILAHEAALQDVLNLLDSANLNALQETDLRVMDPLVRGQLQEIQLRIRREIVAMKNYVYKLRRVEQAIAENKS
jgi:hypothetical protein